MIRQIAPKALQMQTIWPVSLIVLYHKKNVKQVFFRFQFQYFPEFFLEFFWIFVEFFLSKPLFPLPDNFFNKFTMNKKSALMRNARRIFCMYDNLIFLLWHFFDFKHFSQKEWYNRFRFHNNDFHEIPSGLRFICNS